MRRLGTARDSAAVTAGELAATDTLFEGRLTLLQPRRGYRVNVDTLLLAAFAVAGRPKARRVVDLGAGVGALALAYAFLGTASTAPETPQGRRIELVEREPALALLAEQNLARAGYAGTIHVADLERDGLPEALRGMADVVLSNPPFFPEESGTLPGKAKRGARMGQLSPFAIATGAALGQRAYAYFVYPAPALPALLDAAARAELVPKRMRFVHAFRNSPARLVLVELRRAKPGGLVVEAPLVEWAAIRVRSPEVEALVAGKAFTPRAGDRE